MCTIRLVSEECDFITALERVQRKRTKQIGLPASKALQNCYTQAAAGQIINQTILALSLFSQLKHADIDQCHFWRNLTNQQSTLLVCQ